MNEDEKVMPREFNTKEDVIFEIVLYILNNQLYRRDIANIHEIEESYRRVYNRLPYSYELDKNEYVKQMNDYNFMKLSQLISSYEIEQRE